MLSTFDPTVYGSPPECLEALKQQGVMLSQRMAARIYSLGQASVQFSLALLEEAAQPGEAQSMLMHKGWLELQPGEKPDFLPEDLCEAVVGEAGTQVVTPDEALAARRGPTGLVPVKSLLSSVLCVPPQAIRPSALWNRDRLDQAMLNILDSEDGLRLVEDFRYLFRALLAHGQDPSGLLVAALRRNIAELNREVASSVRDKLDRERGRVLELLFDPATIRAGLKALEAHPGFGARVAAILLKNLWPLEEYRSDVLRSLAEMSFVGEDPAARSELAELFWADLDLLVPSQRVRITEILLEWGQRAPELVESFLNRLRSPEGPDQQAFALNLLSQFESAPQEEMRQHFAELFFEQGHRSGILERLLPVFMRLGPETLERLLQDRRRAGLPGPPKAWLVHNGARFRSDSYDGMLVAEVLAGSKPVLLALIRAEMLSDPALVQRFRRLDEQERKILLDFLLAEGERLEDPDNLPVFALICQLGREGLERTWLRLREEAAVNSGASARTLERLSYFLHLLSVQGTLTGEEVDRWVEDCLLLPVYTREALPCLWTGLGRLGGCPGLCEDLAQAVVSRLLRDAGHYRTEQMQGLALVHAGAEEAVRLRVEEVLLQEVSAEQKDRRRLSPALLAWNSVCAGGRLPSLTSALITSLSRTLLWRPDAENVEAALQRALNAMGEDDGTRHHRAWDRDDRNLALRVLGTLALHPQLDGRQRHQLEARLFSFLEDWLTQVSRGKGLYDLRQTVLWDVARELVASPYASERPAELAVEVCLKTLELHHKAPQRLDLRHREDTQRFFVELIGRDLGASLSQKGTRLDLPSTLVELLIELSTIEAEGFERPVSLYFLRLLEERRETLRPPLQRWLELARERFPQELEKS